MMNEVLRLLSPMSEEQLKAFLEAVKADAGLQEKLKAATDAAAAVAIARAAGYVISVEELQRAQSEVSEAELETMAGGVGTKIYHCTISACGTPCPQ